MAIEFFKFIIYSLCIVLIAKYILVKLLRKLAESLQLSSRTVGNIAGFATSIPELLTVSFSAFTGLLGTSIYNILSSNVINFVQYLFSIVLSKNQKILRNKALRIDLCLVALTIFIPMVMLLFSWNFSIRIIPVFLLCFFFFYYLNKNAHKLYLPKQEGILEKEIKAEEKRIHKKAKILITHSILLLLTGGILYWIGNQLSIILENLADSFLVPEWIIGIALGFITSIPELITFFESQKHYKEKEDRELGVIEATNNLLASNILNLFIIQSIGILIFTWSQAQIPYQEEILVVQREKRNVIKILKEKFI